MKLTVTVGPVQVRIVGLDVTERQVRRLLEQAGQIAESLADTSPSPEPEEKAAIGFAVITERGTDPPPEHIFTEDEEWGS